MHVGTVVKHGGTHSETNPTSETNRYFYERKNLISIDFPFIGSVQAPPRIGWRGRPARERGLNENIFMVLALAPPRKAHLPAFCTGGHGRALPGFLGFPCQVPAPTAAAASNTRQPLPHSIASPRQVLPQPSTRRWCASLS